ncbi:MAG TPA: alpha-amylase family glycosyl hydrolase [Flavisolibacter sp.]|nr:alpha-amylase family glycosyl hydrolase [Flavisolibacter sp.]
MKRMLLLAIATVVSCFVNAQLLTWSPPFPQENDPSQTLVITVDAAKGNQGLLNYTPATDVYVHIGVITNLSTSPTNWLYVKFNQNFTQPNAQLQAVYAGNNRWQFTITGSLKTYFGVPANETILKIAILFRNGNGSKVQRNTDGGDMYVPVYNSNLAVRIDQPASQPKYVPVPETQTWVVGSSFLITANASKPSAMKLYHNGTVIASASNVQTISGNSSVTVVGNQQIVAEANDGTTTKYDTLNIFVSPSNSPVAALPAGVRDGINYEAGDTSVTLVLRAPNKNKATVIGDFNNWIQNTSYIMNKTPDGKFFWLRVHPLAAGTEYAYQYIVDDSIKIADPYAEKILDPSNDQYISSATYPNLKAYPAGQTGIVSVLRTAEPAYNWTINNFTRPDKRSLVIYELLVRDFVAAHDWKTVTDSLNYLKTLGINAIEIMPFNEFEGNSSWGYNPDFYFAPDKYYGTKSSLKTFIDSCHKKGIAVIMDIVLNHTYGPSPLKLLYYNSATGQPAANNPWYNQAAPHAFGFGDDFNHESADTKYFFGRVLQHWLTNYKIDGYRFDFSKGLTQKSSSNDATFSAYDASRIAIIKGYYDSIKNVSANAYLILEHFCDNTEEKELSDNGMMLWANVWTQYQEASMGYVSTSNLDGATYVARGWTNPHLVTYMESHDEERITFKNIKYGNSLGSYNVKDTATALKRMELNAAFLFTIPGPKMIWQFGELGYDYSRCYLSTNGDGGDCDKKLDPKPIRWDYLSDSRRKSVYNTYSSLIKLRFHPWYKEAFMSGTIDRSLSGATKWIKLSSGDSSHLLVVGNFDVASQTAAVTFQTSGTWYDYLSNQTIAATGSSQNITLAPGEFHVYVNRNVNNVTVTPVSNVPWNGDEMQAKVYPNPAPSNFIVEVNLPQSSNVKLDLYTSQGQYITTFHNGFLVKGTHQLATKRGTILNGVYYLKIATKSATKTIPITFQ